MSTQKKPAAKPAAKPVAAAPEQAVKPTVKPAAKPVAPAAESLVQPIAVVPEQAVKSAAKPVAKPIAVVPEQVMKSAAAATGNYDAFSVFPKETVDALVQAGNVLTRGAQDFGDACFAFAQSAATANAEAATAMLGAKSLTEFTDLQNAYTKTAFDTSMAETTKLSALSMKVASEAAQPIQSHFATAMAKAQKPAAA